MQSSSMSIRVDNGMLTNNFRAKPSINSMLHFIVIVSSTDISSKFLYIISISIVLFLFVLPYMRQTAGNLADIISYLS